MFFTQSKLAKARENTTYEEHNEFYRVCFSAHSSLDELLEFVNYFKPHSIVPIAKPKHLSSKEVIEMLKVSENVIHSSEELMRSTPLQIYQQPENPLLLEVTQHVLKNKRKLKCPSEDESQDADAPNSSLEARRKRFKSTRLDRVTCSMPAFIKNGDNAHGTGKTNETSRRASLPANIKIPEITITPSTPSPDSQDDSKSPDHFNFHRRVKMDLDDSSVEMKDDTSCDLNETPDFEEVLASASTEEERQNVLKYDKVYQQKIPRTSTL